jgi:Tol biopolymer transport system component
MTLWIAGPDRSDARMVTELSPRFLIVMTPRISPDGSAIVFAGVAQRANTRGQDQGFAPRAGARHGLPMDVYKVMVADGSVVQLTDFGEDEPYPAWSADGSMLTVMATGGLYQMTADGGDLHRIGPGEFGGHVDAR